jgi:hypothetical protein
MAHAAPDGTRRLLPSTQAHERSGRQAGQERHALASSVVPGGTAVPSFFHISRASWKDQKQTLHTAYVYNAAGRRDVHHDKNIINHQRRARRRGEGQWPRRRARRPGAAGCC